MIKIENQEQFNSVVLKGEKPVLVDFFADWCGPCKALAPLLEELDKEATSYFIAKVNIDELPELAMQYRVVSIPTLLVFKEGEVTNRSVGLVNRKEVEALL